jgi:hypothetical protein
MRTPRLCCRTLRAQVDAISLQYELDRNIRLDLLETDPGRRHHHPLLTKRRQLINLENPLLYQCPCNPGLTELGLNVLLVEAARFLNRVRAAVVGRERLRRI